MAIKFGVPRIGGLFQLIDLFNPETMSNKGYQCKIIVNRVIMVIKIEEKKQKKHNI